MSDESRPHEEIAELDADAQPSTTSDADAGASPAPSKGVALSVLWWFDAEDVERAS